ncbi:MAG: Gfo/Idh/MocA family oxidoreductase, partial [Anaerolineaceae bacterium]
MEENRKARIAVIGVGIMGSQHVRDLGRISNTQLAAVCDIDRSRADEAAAQNHVPAFHDYHDLLDKVELDGVMVATPHYFHTPISIDALQRGIHVLSEKPLAVHVKDGQKMIAACEQARQKFPELVFAIMFQNRTQGYWRKGKELIEQGVLGRLVRATWIITDWFRSQTYYDNGGWRATWKGEGGGVLLNQCPHNLDMYQWYFGMPKRVAGYASIGKYHRIEVEDEVTGYFEHENGMVGHFITTTAESPGSNRLEIVGENGRLIFEDGRLTFAHNRSSMLDYIHTSPSAFDRMEYLLEDIPFQPAAEVGHAYVIEAFANAILHG